MATLEVEVRNTAGPVAGPRYGLGPNSRAIVICKAQLVGAGLQPFRAEPCTYLGVLRSLASENGKTNRCRYSADAGRFDATRS